MTILIDPRQRMWLRGMIGRERGNRDKMMKFELMATKLDMDQAYRDKFLRQTMNGYEWDTMMLQEEPLFEFEISKEEAICIKEMFFSFNDFSVDDISIVKAIEDKIADAVLKG